MPLRGRAALRFGIAFFLKVMSPYRQGQAKKYFRSLSPIILTFIYISVKIYGNVFFMGGSYAEQGY